MSELTELAHRASRVKPGDVAIDATAGNGHDTLFLAERVGPAGIVYAFDIQEAALRSTAKRLAAAGMTNVRLFQNDHAHMPSWIEPQHHGNIAAVMFNLGYLPGGDKTMITRTTSTLAAIDAGLQLLRLGGILTVLAYPGHPGGREEMLAVEALISERSTRLISRWYTAGSAVQAPPRLLLAKKIEA